MKKILLILMFILTLSFVNAEFSSYSNVFIGTWNSTSSYVRTYQTLIVGSDYDERLRVANDGNVQALVVYSVEDLSGGSWSNIDFVNVTCTFTDAFFNQDGKFYAQNSSVVHSVIYTTINTPANFIVVDGEYGISDQIQCIYTAVYNTNTNITVDYPYAEETITPSYRTNFVELALDSLEIQQAENTINTLQTYQNNVAEWTHNIILNVYELWLIVYWFIKIGIVYVAFLAVLLAIVFPVLMLIRFRKKVRQWLELDKEVR